MKLHIKNMVCNRCKMAVQSAFDTLQVPVESVVLGEVTLPEPLLPETRQQLDAALTALGFEIIDDAQSRLIEKIKTIIVELVHHSTEAPNRTLSAILSEALHYDYKYLSNLFSEVEGITIEKYAIAQKIERVEELLVYDELSLSQIADQLGYSSVAYLSAQFKKQTGLTPTFYKARRQQDRRNLDDL